MTFLYEIGRRFFFVPITVDELEGKIVLRKAHERLNEVRSLDSKMC